MGLGYALHRRTLSLYNVVEVLFADLPEHEEYKGKRVRYFFVLIFVHDKQLKQRK